MKPQYLGNSLVEDIRVTLLELCKRTVLVCDCFANQSHECNSDRLVIPTVVRHEIRHPRADVA